MGLRGPARTPTAILHAQGSRLAASRQGTEPRFPAGAPKCPKKLSKGARAVWKRVAPLLEAQGLLTQADEDSLVGYCVAVNEVDEALAMLERDGRTIMAGTQMQPHPAVAMLTRAMGLVKTYGDLFGLSPSARSRVQAAPAEQKPSGKARFFGGA